MRPRRPFDCGIRAEGTLSVCKSSGEASENIHRSWASVSPGSCARPAVMACIVSAASNLASTVAVRGCSGLRILRSMVSQMAARFFDRSPSEKSDLPMGT